MQDFFRPPTRAAFLGPTAGLALVPRVLSAQALTKVRIAGAPDGDMAGALYAQQSMIGLITAHAKGVPLVMVAAAAT